MIAGYVSVPVVVFLEGWALGWGVEVVNKIPTWEVKYQYFVETGSWSHNPNKLEDEIWENVLMHPPGKICCTFHVFSPRKLFLDTEMQQNSGTTARSATFGVESSDISAGAHRRQVNHVQAHHRRPSAHACLPMYLHADVQVLLHFSW